MSRLMTPEVVLYLEWYGVSRLVLGVLIGLFARHAQKETPEMTPTILTTVGYALYGLCPVLPELAALVAALLLVIPAGLSAGVEFCVNQLARLILFLTRPSEKQP